MKSKQSLEEMLLDFIKQAVKQVELLSKIKEIIDRPFETPFPSMLEEAERYVEIEELLRSLENE